MFVYVIIINFIIIMTAHNIFDYEYTKKTKSKTIRLFYSRTVFYAFKIRRKNYNYIRLVRVI
jgi:hypothetical protein